MINKQLIGLVVGLVLTSYTLAEQRRVWDGKPMTLVLPMNHEVRVTFPQNVEVQLPETMVNQLQTLAPNAKTLYWTAKEPFEKVRVFATSEDQKHIYILDVSASNKGSKQDVAIENPNYRAPSAVARNQSASPNEHTTAPIPANHQPTPSAKVPNDPPAIILTRFVAQTLYAPDRLIPTDPNIQRVNVPKLAADFPLMQSFNGEDLEFKVIAGWSGYGAYITAVQVNNLSGLSVAVDPSRVRGNFSHITPHHTSLGHQHSVNDRTTLYLVSSVPFESAVSDDGYGY